MATDGYAQGQEGRHGHWACTNARRADVDEKAVG
jgi:hypothetical protein